MIMYTLYTIYSNYIVVSILMTRVGKADTSIKLENVDSELKMYTITEWNVVATYH